MKIYISGNINFVARFVDFVLGFRCFLCWKIKSRIWFIIIRFKIILAHFWVHGTIQNRALCCRYTWEKMKATGQIWAENMPNLFRKPVVLEAETRMDMIVRSYVSLWFFFPVRDVEKPVVMEYVVFEFERVWVDGLMRRWIFCFFERTMMGKK